MSWYEELKAELKRLQNEGHVIEQIEMPSDMQQEIIAELLDQAEPTTLQDCPDFLGLTSIEGYPVVRVPAGQGIKIRYDEDICHTVNNPLLPPSGNTSQAKAEKR